MNTAKEGSGGHGSHRLLSFRPHEAYQKARKYRAKCDAGCVDSATNRFSDRLGNACQMRITVSAGAVGGADFFSGASGRGAVSFSQPAPASPPLTPSPLPGRELVIRHFRYCSMQATIDGQCHPATTLCLPQATLPFSKRAQPSHLSSLSTNRSAIIHSTLTNAGWSHAAPPRTTADSRRPTARHAVGVAALRKVPALRAARLRRPRHPVGR